jgi:hypothetical protein
MVHGLHQMYHWLRNCFGSTQRSGDEAQVEARFGLFGDGAILNTMLVHGLR